MPVFDLLANRLVNQTWRLVIDDVMSKMVHPSQRHLPPSQLARIIINYRISLGNYNDIRISNADEISNLSTYVPRLSWLLKLYTGPRKYRRAAVDQSSPLQQEINNSLIEIYMPIFRIRQSVRGRNLELILEDAIDFAQRQYNNLYDMMNTEERERQRLELINAQKLELAAAQAQVDRDPTNPYSRNFKGNPDMYPDK
jgi:hypothetical protein